MRRITQGLRTGWTTGTCASAAAKAAAAALLSGIPVPDVEVGLPSGRRVSFPVERCEVGEGWAEAVVVKDAGDDPDATHGAHLTARVRLLRGGDVVLRGGEGVGTVTKPGLGLPVGAPAVNPVPEAMIRGAVAEAAAAGPAAPGAGREVTISVPGGEDMARRTTNGRLGIVGGISILGTTGIVRPFSTAAYRASVAQAIDVAAAQGLTEMVLSTGGRTEAAAMAAMPWHDGAAFVEVGDFTGFALRHCARAGMQAATFVAMMGKLTKLAAGVMMTHYTRSRVDVDVLAALAAEAGCPDALAAGIREANTARHAFEMAQAAGDTALFARLVARVRDNLVAPPRGPPRGGVVMVDFAGHLVVAGEGVRWGA